MARKKNESNRARKVRRAVVGKFKIESKPKAKATPKAEPKPKVKAKPKANNQKAKGSGAKKGTKKSGRFEGKTTAEIRAFKEAKGRGKFAKEEVSPIVEPVELDTTETQLPDTTPSFDYEGALAEMKAEFEERQRLADEKYARKVAEFEQAERTQMENQARAGQQTEYKLGSPSERMRGGTFGFRRRKKRGLMRGIASTLAAGTSGMLNF